MRLEIPRELKSPNKWQGRHWRYKHRETTDWERELQIAWLSVPKKVQQKVREDHDCIMRVRVERHCPSARNFIRDDDNLRFSTKPLNDALKRVGFIVDDNRKWLVQGLPEQRVSVDAQWRTVIEIDAYNPATATETAR